MRSVASRISVVSVSIFWLTKSHATESQSGLINDDDQITLLQRMSLVPAFVLEDQLQFCIADVVKLNARTVQ